MPAAPRGTIVLREALRFATFAAQTWPGSEVGTVLFKLGLVGDAAPDPERRVPIEPVFELWAQVTRAARDPAVPLRFAQSKRVEDSGVLGLAAMTAPSIRAALERAARYQRLISNSGSWRITDLPDLERVRLTWVRPGARSLGHRLANETVLAEMVVGARQVLGEVHLSRVGFRHGPPSQADFHRKFFAAPLEWNAREDYVELPSSLLDRRPVAADAVLARSFVQEAERRLAVADGISLAARVQSEIEDAMLSGTVGTSSVAARLGTSQRTLRRALAQEGTCYRDVLDATRKEQALELLGRRSTNITDAAFLLGFSETSAFSRAFRRWFGVPPTEARAVALGATRR